MSDALFFFHEDLSEAERRGAPFRERGWSVHLAGIQADGVLDRIAEFKPLAAVFCMESCDADQLKQLATSVMDDARMLRPLMVFVGGSAEEAAALKQDVPYGVFVHEDELEWVLKHLAIKF